MLDKLKKKKLLESLHGKEETSEGKQVAKQESLKEEKQEKLPKKKKKE